MNFIITNNGDVLRKLKHQSFEPILTKHAADWIGILGIKKKRINKSKVLIRIPLAR